MKAKPEGISARDLAEFIDILDFAEYDPDYSDDNVYGILSVEKEDYNDSRGGEGGKTASIYDAENKTFAGIETENPAEGQYAYIALLKYGTKDKDRHMGEAIAHICWKW